MGMTSRPRITACRSPWPVGIGRAVAPSAERVPSGTTTAHSSRGAKRGPMVFPQGIATKSPPPAHNHAGKEGSRCAGGGIYDMHLKKIRASARQWADRAQLAMSPSDIAQH